MRREPVVYAALLVAGLAVAFRSWTHQRPADVADDSFEIWHGQPEAIQSIEYTQPGHRLEMRRAGPDSAPYLWATEDTAAFRMDAGTGRQLLKAVAAPRVQHDFGAPDARARRAYGLDTSRTRLVVRFRDGTRELLLGGLTVDRTGSRYVLESRSGHVYILPSLALPPLADAAQLLVEHQIHAYPLDSVMAVTVRYEGRTLSLHRLPGKGTAGGGPIAMAWARTDGPQKPDSALTAFMWQVSSLATATYAAREDPRTMSPVARLDYADRRGQHLGYLEVFQRPAASGKPEYFARTELTDYLVRLYVGAGEGLAATLAKGL